MRVQHIRCGDFHVWQDADGSGSHHQASQRASVATALDDYDPEALAMHCLLPRDDTIRRTDLPERFQERMGAGPKVEQDDVTDAWWCRSPLLCLAEGI